MPGSANQNAFIVYSINYILSGALVLPFGLLLELPGFRIPHALLVANLFMTSAHLAFFLVGGCIGPLVALGVMNALYGVASWAGVAKSIVHAGDQAARCRPKDPEQDSLTSTYEVDPKSADPVDDHLTAVGFGCVASVLNTSAALVPFLLAVVESRAGYPGLEMVFVAFGVFGCLAAAQLMRMSNFL